MIVDISGDTQPANAYNPSVTSATIRGRITALVTASNILAASKVSNAIGTYGGIFFTGFTGNAAVPVIVNKAAWSVTQNVSPFEVAVNTQTYLNTQYYTTQAPLAYNTLKVDPYISASTATLTSSSLNLAQAILDGTFEEIVASSPAVILNAFPSYLLEMAPLSNRAFFRLAKYSKTMRDRINIINMDAVDKALVSKALHLNFIRLFPHQ